METRLYHIGRHKISNEIYIDDVSVSSSHAQILIDENKDHILIDLSSKNGVIVNGNKIQSPVKLLNEDSICFGNFTFTKQDILNAIELFEKHKNSGNNENISLTSSIQKNTSKSSFNTKKILLIILIVLASVTLGFVFVNYLKKQNTIKEKLINNTNDQSKGIDLPGSDNNDNSKKEEIKPINNKKIVKKPIIIIKQRTDLIYDFSCLNNKDDGGSNEMIVEFGDLTRNIQSTILKDVEISIKDEKQEGNKYINDLKKQKKFISQGRSYSKLNRIMKNLTSRIVKPRGIDYEIFFVDDTIKNVFTLGGNIVFYKGMFDFCQNDSEIAAIISHEIAHNELGHSTLMLKKQKMSNNYGIFGEIALMFESIASASFNQKQEAEADMFGLDLIYPTSFSNCAGISFWERFGEEENDFDITDNLFKTHPYSVNRINCLHNHYKSNYNKNCN